MPRQSRRGPKSSFPKMFKGCAKANWKVGKPEQTEEAESAFKQMKQHIAKLPMLTALEEREELIIYLAAPKKAVSVVLMTERETKQMLIYFVSRTLRGPEVNYTLMEKLVLALVHASKRLKRGAAKIEHRAGRICNTLKANSIYKRKIITDFIVKRPEEDTPIEVEEELPKPWILFTDGSSCADGFRAGLILTDLEGT
ncbi:reverse transcriptase domain-containing protein [Tanacetum coccineum]